MSGKAYLLIAMAVGAIALALYVLLSSRETSTTPEYVPVLESLPPNVGDDSVFRALSAADANDKTVEAQALFNLKSIYEKSKLWPSGSTLRVAFIGGTHELHGRIVGIASDWVQNANVDLDFGESDDGSSYRRAKPDDTSEIRLSFTFPQKPLRWSYVGLEALRLASPGEPTVNLQGLNDIAVPDEEFRFLVLHEFGHALGFEHEHRNPKGNCDGEYDWFLVYMSYETEYGLRKPAVDKILRSLPSSDAFEASEHDAKSIMHYNLPEWYFTRKSNSPCFVEMATRLSDLDRDGVAAAYLATTQERWESMFSDVQELIDRGGLSTDIESEFISTLSESFENTKKLDGTVEFSPQMHDLINEGEERWIENK